MSNLKNRLDKLEKLQPQQIKHKRKPLACYYGEDIPESEWPEYDSSVKRTLADFYADNVAQKART